MIDSHCHLADRKFAADLPEVITRAKEVGVTTMITIADSLDEAERCIAIAEEYPEVFATVGVHPHCASEWKVDRSVGQECSCPTDRLSSLVKSCPKVVAIGEIGLDYHYLHSPKDVQQKVFREQLVLAGELGLPVVVHCRDAIVDVRTIVEEIQPKCLVLHCCTERWNDVSWAVERGYFLSFTGIATYPSAGEIRETIRTCPIEKLMVETDAPYLAPVPHRGKRNEPAFVMEVAKLVAELKGISLEEVDRITSENAIRFFALSDS